MGTPSDTRVQRAQDLLALQQELEGSGSSLHTRGIKRANRVLERAGVEAGGGSYLSALENIARQGAVGGKRSQLLSQAVQMGNINENEELVTSRGQDDIARSYQTMSEAFAGTLGVDMDTSSPAVLDSVRRYVEGRSADTTRFLSNVKQTANDQRNAVLANQIGPTLDATGQLIESLKMLEEEQDMLAQAQRGSIFGNPFSATASLFGAGRGAALGFGNAMMNTGATLASIIGALPSGSGASTARPPIPMFPTR